jgi:signal transduction histidine kinase
VRVSARLRLTLLLGALVAAAGVALLVASYLMVRANLGAIPSPLSRDARIVQEALADDALRQLKVQYGLALGALVAFSLGVGWIVAGRVLRPIGEIAAAARRVSGDRMGERIALGGPRDELRDLADAVDDMLDRLEDAFASQRRFVANASHELRTPLAVMRTELEVTLADPDAPAEELRETAREVRDAVIRAERLVGALLTLARSEAAVVRRDRTDLALAARHALGDLGAEVAMHRLAVETEIEPASACGDGRLLERLVANLVENAVRHNVRDGWIVVRTGTVGDAAVVEVRNGGPVIPPERVATLAQPFQRLDRGARGDGAGLGLSLVAAVARAHGGDLELEAPPEGGFVARVRLPSRPQVAEPARPVPSEMTR